MIIYFKNKMDNETTYILDGNNININLTTMTNKIKSLINKILNETKGRGITLKES